MWNQNGNVSSSPKNSSNFSLLPLIFISAEINALGAKDQACATFAELERKYPQAPASVREGAEREQKRARCAA